MVYGLLAFLIGGAYGYFAKGRQDKPTLFKRGLLWGIIIAAVFVLIGLLVDFNPISATANFLWLALDVVIIVGLFVLGVYVGDWIEHRDRTGETH